MDGHIYKTECSDWYNTGDCYTETYCGEVNEGGGGTAADDGCDATYVRLPGDSASGSGVICPCEVYGTCAPSCDQTLVDEELEQFNDYTSFNENSVLTVTSNLSNYGLDGIIGAKTVDIVVAKLGAWKIQADITYGYYHTNYFNGIKNVEVYDLFNFKTSDGYFSGSNSFITSIYTTTTPTVNQVTNNNTADCLGTSYVLGTITHKLKLTDKIPFCFPITFEKTDNINGTVYFRPK
jgi:hypothetical protein